MNGSGWTSHGHRIEGLLQVGKGPTSVARCGGEPLCRQCSAEAEQARVALSSHPFVKITQLIVSRGLMDDPQVLQGWLNGLMLQPVSELRRDGSASVVTITLQADPMAPGVVAAAVMVTERRT